LEHNNLTIQDFKGLVSQCQPPVSETGPEGNGGHRTVAFRRRDQQTRLPEEGSGLNLRHVRDTLCDTHRDTGVMALSGTIELPSHLIHNN